MAIAIGTKAVGFGPGGGSQYSTNVGSTAPSGSIFLIIEHSTPGAINLFTAPTDNFGNTYTSHLKQNDTTNGIGFQVWKCIGGTGGASHTIGGHDGNAGFSTCNVQFVEITGADLVTPTDGITQANVTGPPFNASLTTTNAKDLILAFYANATSTGAVSFSSAGFSLVNDGSLSGQNQASTLWSKIVSSAAAYDPAFGVVSGSSAAGPIATFAFREANILQPTAAAYYLRA